MSMTRRQLLTVPSPKSNSGQRTMPPALLVMWMTPQRLSMGIRQSLT